MTQFTEYISYRPDESKSNLNLPKRLTDSDFQTVGTTPKTTDNTEPKDDSYNPSPTWFKNYDLPDNLKIVANTLFGDQSGQPESDIVSRAIARSKQGTYQHNGETIPIGTTSNGQCTYGPSSFYQELGLQGSFWDTRNPTTAMATKLTEKGFDRVWQGNFNDVRNNSHLETLRPGDLMVTYGKKGNGNDSAHIAMWNGDEWVSDFKQKGALVYNTERMGASGNSVEILRLNPSKVKKAEKGMKIDKDDSTEEKPLLSEDEAYKLFLATAPDNIKHTDPEKYRMRRYWELHGKPRTFQEAIKKGNMFFWDDNDRSFHSSSVAKNENGEYEFMKAIDHPTTHMELDWFRSGKIYNGDDSYYLTPQHGKDYEEWQDFVNNYDLVEPVGDDKYYKYVPKKKTNDVPKDENGAKIIVIEKEVVKEPEEEKDPLKCLLCQIMNALGHRHHAFSELRPDKLTDIFGGNAEIVIELGGPEKAYDENLFEEMLKDILPMVSTTKKYNKEDIAEIRSKKAEHGTSMKRLLSLMDDDKILKAFNGMQLFKTGGEIQFDAKGGQLENLSKITIQIGETEYHVYETKTEEQRRTGLKGVTHLKHDEGMIFYWDEPQDNLTMTMVDCKIPLKIVSFNEDFEVLESPVCSPNENPIVMPVGTKYVVELHPDAQVKKGDELDLPGDDDEYVMQVLGSDGSIQMQLKGGERIFSRPNTKMLLKWSKQSYKSNNSSDYMRLGRLLFKYLDKQDNREPEYVSLDSKND